LGITAKERQKFVTEKIDEDFLDPNSHQEWSKHSPFTFTEDFSIACAVTGLLMAGVAIYGTFKHLRWLIITVISISIKCFSSEFQVIIDECSYLLQ
jgi:hypothetical protein